MSQFYAEIQGHRGNATRQGTKSSGIWGHIRGWNIGARVELSYDKSKDRDILRVYVTSGSNGGDSKLIYHKTDKPKLMTNPAKTRTA